MTSLVYILFDKYENIINVYHNESQAINDAKLFRLKDWYILSRGLK
jgi:hypothetical protein